MILRNREHVQCFLTPIRIVNLSEDLSTEIYIIKIPYSRKSLSGRMRTQRWRTRTQSIDLDNFYVHFTAPYEVSSLCPLIKISQRSYGHLNFPVLKNRHRDSA